MSTHLRAVLPGSVKAFHVLPQVEGEVSDVILDDLGSQVLFFVAAHDEELREFFLELELYVFDSQEEPPSFLRLWAVSQLQATIAEMRTTSATLGRFLDSA